MTIIYKKGNVFDTECKLIMHGCNAQGVMGSGIALQIKEQYPVAYLTYRNHYLEHGLRLGDVIVAPTHDKRIILNAITQEYYGRDKNITYVDYAAIRICMSYVKVMFMLDKDIAMPKIGCGLANGDWNIVEEIINEQLEEFNVEVWEL